LHLCDLDEHIATTKFNRKKNENRSDFRATEQHLERLDCDGAKVGEGGGVLRFHLRCAETNSTRISSDTRPRYEERGGEEAAEAVHFRPRMVVSGATSIARRVPRSVSMKREMGASPPSRCALGGRGDGGAAAIAGGGRRRRGQGHRGKWGTESNRRGFSFFYAKCARS